MTRTAVSSKPRSEARAIEVALSVNATTALPYVLIGASAVRMTDELGFDEAALGVLLSLFSLGGLLISPFAGFLIERMGASRGLRFAAGVAAVTSLLVALAGRSWWSLALIMLVGGTASGLTSPAANLWIARAVPRDRHGFALGMKQAANPVTSILGGLAVPLVVLPLGWRWGFVGAAILAVLAMAFVPRLPRQPRPTSVAPAPSLAVSGASTRPDDPDAAAAGIKRRALLVLMVGTFLGFVAQSPLQAFYVVSAVDAGVDQGLAGFMLAAGGIASLAMRVGIGAVADRGGRSVLKQVAMLLVGGGIAYSVFATGRPALIVAMTPIVFCTANGWSGLVHLAVVQSHPEAPAAATGIIMLGSYGGVVVGPTLFGLIAQRSYPVAWAVWAVILVMAAVTMLAAQIALRRSAGADASRRAGVPSGPGPSS